MSLQQHRQPHRLELAQQPKAWRQPQPPGSLQQELPRNLSPSPGREDLQAARSMLCQAGCSSKTRQHSSAANCYVYSPWFRNQTTWSIKEGFSSSELYHKRSAVGTKSPKRLAWTYRCIFDVTEPVIT